MANTISDMLAPTVVDPDATLVDVFGEKSKDADDIMDYVYSLHGTIGSTPYHETDEFRQEAFDIAEGLAFPGAGIGASIRGGKQALDVGKGGWRFLTKYMHDLSKMKLVDPKKVAKIKPSQIDKDWKKAYDALMKSPPKMQPRAKPPTGLKKEMQDWLKRNVPTPSQPRPGMPSELKHGFSTEYIVKRNKEAIKRLADEKKYKEAREALESIYKKYKIPDPDKAEFVDSITALLSKWSKN